MKFNRDIRPAGSMPHLVTLTPTSNGMHRSYAVRVNGQDVGFGISYAPEVGMYCGIIPTKDGELKTVNGTIADIRKVIAQVNRGVA
jgi:hypothetical protein